LDRPTPFREYDLKQARQSGSTVIPFSHQNVALGRINEWFAKAPRPGAGGIVVLPTGGGKTFTAIRFLCSSAIAKGYKVLWLAHTHHLLDQAFLAFERSVGTIPGPKATLSARVVSGTFGHQPVHKIEPTDDVVVATLQTTALAYQERHHRLLAFLESAGDKLCVVFDEAHHAPAPGYRRLLAALKADHAEMVLIGLTATPTNGNPRKVGWLKELFPQGIIHQSQAAALIADGVLARPNFERIPTEVTPEFDQDDYERWVDTYRDLPESIIESLAKNRERNALIAEHYASNRDRYGRTIIFAERWYQCEQIESFLKARGIRADSVFSKIDASPATVEARNARKSTDNHRTLESFRAGEIDVLLNVKMLTEGTDVPQTQTVFLTRQTTSTILLTQMVGRALRGPRAGGTAEAYIVSFQDNWAQKINWADFDPLLAGPKDDGETVRGKRPPVQLIPVDLVRRLADQMDSGVNVAPMEFRKLLPKGWYAVEFDALAEGTEDVETVRQLVMVFEDQAEGYGRFLADLGRHDLTRLNSERSTISESRPFLDESIGRYFPDQADEITRVGAKELFHLARHVAQNDGALPPYFPFEDRAHYDVDALVNGHLDRKLDLLSVNQSLKDEYARPDRFWGSLYPSFDLFKTQHDACLNRILKGPPPPTPDLPVLGPPCGDREPSKELKREVKSRDRYKCLCCGEEEKRRLQVDHVVSYYHGGPTDLENLQTLCKECNADKGKARIDFRKPCNAALVEPPDGLPALYHPTEGHEADAELWALALRRTLNFFYRAAAVETIRIGRRGRSFYEWGVLLTEGNQPSWLGEHLAELLSTIREVRGKAGLDGPEGIRVTSPGFPEAVHFRETDPEAEPSALSIVPNGAECRLSFGGKEHLGVIRGGRLRLSRRAPFRSFAAAYRDIAGQDSKNSWREWEIRLPGSSEWVRGDRYRKRFPAI